ncbi:MAG: hypothetical protein IH994_09995 [Proteobacteria bacterium]|nr:hypothetical protein [Pseudomonadota bacterium]
MENTEPNIHFGPLDLPSHSLGLVTVLAPVRGTMAILPAGYPLRRATFSRRKSHLMVKAHGHPRVVVPHFFANDRLTTLVTEDGIEVSRHMVMLMSSLSSRVEKALNAMAIPASDS